MRALMKTSAGPGLSVGVIKGTITIPGVGQILNMNLLVRALQQDTSANILSTPTLLTTDNEEARIVADHCMDAGLCGYEYSGLPKILNVVEHRQTREPRRAMRVIREGDFIKTSTGKTSLNATLGNNQVMLEAIRDFYLDTGIAIGMKPATWPVVRLATCETVRPAICAVVSPTIWSVSRAPMRLVVMATN